LRTAPPAAAAAPARPLLDPSPRNDTLPSLPSPVRDAFNYASVKTKDTLRVFVLEVGL